MGSAQTLGMSAAMGASLIGITILLGWLHIQSGWNDNMLKWFLLPTLGFLVAFGLNSILQYTTCNTVKLKQVAYGSSTVLIFILLGLILTLSSTVRSPIESIVPAPYKSSYGGIYAIAFYMFWSGMFGEAIASGFAQSCNP
jgi:hypothetical protein